MAGGDGFNGKKYYREMRNGMPGIVDGILE